ncbi:UvrD-helicase domain-containing protein [Enterobacter ludwigii]|uniref:UvrD-helicase domain-containing protein n=2 Tax=Enterobacteriaceae TaxID=543 RepID=A0AAX3LFA5_9ENTR|nr:MULTISPECIES: UvrD-helicase domain-containing protein [Enterobacteriaceae]MBX8913805.1 UvrD-helicase domain-containing protein [Enterobacter ludwigii]MCM7780964.1 UvrD-helicase domain-containing protein [Enterobacter ludwigii]WCE14643.1 UvrD-helicase domain-containing protein [Enterobacter ludwigii]HCR1965381.1 UvrD-helicase domain-containing protein [Enterobacter kobei]
MPGYLKKIAAWLLRAELEKIRIDEHESGRIKGYEEGHTRGLREGRELGLEEGKNLFVIQGVRESGVFPDIDNSVYGPERFPVSATLAGRMEDAVATAVSAGIVSAPTASQWKMILSDHPSTCVVAGAGSGKSTTLVLRVVFMHCYLNIPLNEITVISFTRDSCKELRAKIYHVLKFWRDDLTKERVFGLVRTFHSALSAFSHDLLAGKTWFDTLKDNDEVLLSEDDDIDNPFSSGKMSVKQKMLLNEAYVSLFNDNQRFRKEIIELMKLAALSAPVQDDSDLKKAALRNAGKRDLELAMRLNEVWAEKGLWPIAGVVREPVKCFTTEGHVFYANGLIESTGQPVFLSSTIDNEYFFDKSESFCYRGYNGKEEQFPILSCLSLRNKIMAWRCDKPFIFIDSSSKLRLLRFLARQENEDSVTEVPFFDVKLAGELTETDIVELMYQQASFIESMGMEVSFAIKNIRNFKRKGLEYHFCCAIIMFWNYFENMIIERGYITFNRAFLIFSDSDFLRNHRDKLRHKYIPLRHLLIDEFQDISPQIAMWIKAVQQELAQQEREPSIMAIGDDWQSIYAWRGSSPEIFMKFSHFFPTHESLSKNKNIHMMENFRSDGQIIHDAELLMKNVHSKIDKMAIPCRKPDGDESGVEFIDYDPADERWVKDAVNLIRKQIALVSEQQKSDKNKVIVLSRTNITLKKIKAAGRFGRNVAFHTIHTAKGLQGEVAVIFEDSRSLQGNTFRNRIYEIVEYFSSTYDDAMEDEALRLAYVAVTRGVKRVYWCAPKNSKGAYNILKTACLRERKNSVTVPSEIML